MSTQCFHLNVCLFLLFVIPSVISVNLKIRLFYFSADLFFFLTAMIYLALKTPSVTQKCSSTAAIFYHFGRKTSDLATVTAGFSQDYKR